MSGVDADLATLRDYAGWATAPASHKRAVKGVEAELSRLREQRGAANERATKLNRRATQAEAVVMQTVEDCKRQGVSFGRALANSACNALQARAEAAEARCARLQQALDQARACVIVDFYGGARSRAVQVIDEALAGPDTPADSQPEEPTT